VFTGGNTAVHLHPSQLSPEVVATIRDGGIEIHAWEVNNAPTLHAMLALDIPKLCTDHPQQMLALLGRESH
jgi:glycerophosphoryl diester phosphodiesterase